MVYTGGMETKSFMFRRCLGWGGNTRVHELPRLLTSAGDWVTIHAQYFDGKEVTDGFCRDCAAAENAKMDVLEIQLRHS